MRIDLHQLKKSCSEVDLSCLHLPISIERVFDWFNINYCTWYETSTCGTPWGKTSWPTVPLVQPGYWISSLIVWSLSFFLCFSFLFSPTRSDLQDLTFPLITWWKLDGAFRSILSQTDQASNSSNLKPKPWRQNFEKHEVSFEFRSKLIRKQKKHSQSRYSTYPIPITTLLRWRCEVRDVRRFWFKVFPLIFNIPFHACRFLFISSKRKLSLISKASIPMY